MSKEFNVFTDKDALLKYYEIQNADLRMRHTAIWFEVKHYTWVLSILIGGGPLAIATGKLSFDNGVPFLLFPLVILGIIVSILAFCIIKNDFNYYTRAEGRLLYLEKCLGVIDTKGYLDKHLLDANINNFTVQKYIDDKELSIKQIIRTNKIRCIILKTFLIYGLGGVAIFGYYIHITLSPYLDLIHQILN